MVSTSEVVCNTSTPSDMYFSREDAMVTERFREKEVEDAGKERRRGGGGKRKIASDQTEKKAAKSILYCIFTLIQIDLHSLHFYTPTI